MGSTGSEALGHSDESHAIAARLIAIRSKLKRLQAGKVNVKYEVSELTFSSNVQSLIHSPFVGFVARKMARSEIPYVV